MRCTLRAGERLRFRGAALTEEAMEDDGFALDSGGGWDWCFRIRTFSFLIPRCLTRWRLDRCNWAGRRAEILERVQPTLEWIGAEQLKDRAPYRLSGGEKKRVALASVMVLDPDVLLLDEPTASLDPRSQSQVIELLESWNDGRKTIITATHQLEILGEIAERAVVLKSGAVVADAAPTEVLANTGLLESANLIHSHRHLHGGVSHRHPRRTCGMSIISIKKSIAG